MTKTQAVKIFCDRKALAKALGITLSAISRWPDPLSTALADRIAGACLRLNMMRRYNKVMQK